MQFLIKNNKQANYNKAKLIVVGSGGAGKTSLCNSLLEKHFNPNHLSTVVAKAAINVIDTKDVDISNSKWREITKGDNLVSNYFQLFSFVWLVAWKI